MCEIRTLSLAGLSNNKTKKVQRVFQKARVRGMIFKRDFHVRGRPFRRSVLCRSLDRRGVRRFARRRARRRSAARGLRTHSRLLSNDERDTQFTVYVRPGRARDRAWRPRLSPGRAAS